MTQPTTAPRPRRHLISKSLAAVFWGTTVLSLYACAPYMLVLTVWAAAEGGKTLAHVLLLVGRPAALDAALVAAVWYSLSFSRLSLPTRSAVVGALAFPGPLWFALAFYTRGGAS
ncbi:hypothetical protein [Streptomyces sp. UNOC14_S4]|uniref:hypothetical protein n=1 Tax=Streptomyces sp. UNOC14_S4 TaxID=2872340 RepID=UPI001E3C9C87|nr:hypothetical protein [Streptomyces sp. UNOC14_S4]MCC3769608.1 hypothetical protein [Streptomyces sp. UNOC14_S4]